MAANDKAATADDTLRRIIEIGNRDQLMQFYSDWSSYDEMLSPDLYKAPVLAADEVASLVPEARRQEARVLDVAAGTGKVGLELHKRGFRNIDALDPCEAFLEKLRTWGVYQQVYQEYIGEGKSSLPRDTYDVVLVVGAFSANHVPVSALDEMILTAKPGGVVMGVMRAGALDTPDFQLQHHFEEMEERGVWKKLTLREDPHFLNDWPALTFAYRVP